MTAYWATLILSLAVTLMAKEPTWYPYTATVRAYSIHDPIDKAYHDSRPLRTRFITSTGRDASVWTEGVAGPKSLAGRPVKFTVHGYSQYSAPGNTTRIDDTGGLLRRRIRSTKALHLELRFPTTEEAKKFGIKTMIVYLDTPNWQGTP